MTKLTTMPIKGFYESEYHAVRQRILYASQLDRHTLTDAAMELEVDVEVYPFDELRQSNPHLPEFTNRFEAFMAVMQDGFAEEVWPEEMDSALKGLRPAQYYLVWAWIENEAAHYFLSEQGVENGLDAEQAMHDGLVAALSSQKAYCHGLMLMRLQAGSAAQASVQH